MMNRPSATKKTIRVKIRVPKYILREAEKRAGSLTSEQILLAAAILGWEKLKTMTPEEIVKTLEEATLK